MRDPRRTWPLLLVLFVAACGGQDLRTPQSTANSYLRALQAKDKAGMIACLAEADSKKENPIPSRLFKNDLKSWQLGGVETVDDETRFIAVTSTHVKDGRPETVSSRLFMKSEKGKWRVTFPGLTDMARMMGVETPKNPD